MPRKKKSPKKSKRVAKKKLCRTCKTKKPMSEQNFARMSPACMRNKKDADGFMPDCRQCSALTPTMLHTIKVVKENGKMTAKQLQKMSGLTHGAASNRLKTGHDIGVLNRIGLGVYAVSETGRSLDLSRAGVHSSRQIVDEVVQVNIQKDDTQIAADLLHIVETADLNSEQRTIVMQAFRRLSGLPQSQYAPESGLLMEV